jgi:hypothetical protein
VLQDAARRGRELRFGSALPTTTPSTLQALAPISSESGANLRALSNDELGPELLALAERHAAFRLGTAPGLRANLFRDRGGAPRVLFVTNTTRTPEIARLELAGLGSGQRGEISEAVDALDGAAFRATFGALEVPLSPQSVRMLELK